MKVSVVNPSGGSFCWNYATDTFRGNYAGDNACCINTQVTVSAANMWVTIFIAIMHMGVSVAIMQVVFSAVNYAHDCVNCNYAGDFAL